MLPDAADDILHLHLLPFSFRLSTENLLLDLRFERFLHSFDLRKLGQGFLSGLDLGFLVNLGVVEQVLMGVLGAKPVLLVDFDFIQAELSGEDFREAGLLVGFGVLSVEEFFLLDLLV